MEVWILQLVIFTAGVLSQSDYRLIHERISLDYYNTNWIKDPIIVLFHYTRTQKRYKASGHLLKDISGHDLSNVLQGYKYQSNEYRLFPFNYTSNACDIQKFNTFGTNIANFDTNFTLCPIKKGFYYLANAFVDETKFPPYAPRGRYMIESKVYYNQTILLCSGKWYGAIEPTNPLEKVIVG